MGELDQIVELIRDQFKLLNDKVDKIARLILSNGQRLLNLELM